VKPSQSLAHCLLCHGNQEPEVEDDRFLFWSLTFVNLALIDRCRRSHAAPRLDHPPPRRARTARGTRRPRSTPAGPRARSLDRRSSMRMNENPTKVEDNPLIYFLNHVLNLAIYHCNIDAIWRFTCMILEIRYIRVTKIEPRDNALICV
jgi:hypothetical protein